MTGPGRSRYAIRLAGRRDLAALHRIETLAFPEQPWSREMLGTELEHDWSRILVATPPGDPKTLLGFAIYWTVQDEVHVLDVAVDPSERRRGVASALVEHLVHEARSGGAVFVTLEVRRSNDAAQGLYRGHGFEARRVRRRYYASNDEDAIVMELDL